MHTCSYRAHRSAVYAVSNELKMTHYFNEMTTMDQKDAQTITDGGVLHIPYPKQVSTIVFVSLHLR